MEGEQEEVARMACVTLAALLSLASLTINAVAQSEPSWARQYLRVYPPVSTDEGARGTKSLYFALTMSFGGIFKSSGTIPGVEAALDVINSDPTLLPGYKLHYTLTDSLVSEPIFNTCINVHLKHACVLTHYLVNPCIKLHSLVDIGSLGPYEREAISVVPITACH